MFVASPSTSSATPLLSRSRSVSEAEVINALFGETLIGKGSVGEVGAHLGRVPEVVSGKWSTTGYNNGLVVSIQIDFLKDLDTIVFLSVTYTFPFVLTPTAVGLLRSPGAEPKRPNLEINCPSEVSLKQYSSALTA